MKWKNKQPQKIPIDGGASIVARKLATGYLYRAFQKSEKLVRNSKFLESETLHDFRVAMRQLCGVLKTYKSAFPELSKSDRANLRRVVKATNRARDLEVFITWVQSTKSLFDSSDLRIWSQITTELKDALAFELRRLKSDRLRKFRAFSRDLIKDLDKNPRSNSGNKRESFRHATYEMLEKLRMRLAMQAECAMTCSDAMLLHQMRVTIKRARYLIEPFKDVRYASVTIKHLKELQYVLGDIQDLQVLTVFLIESLAYSRVTDQPKLTNEGKRHVGLKLLEIASKEQKKKVSALKHAWFKQRIILGVKNLKLFTSCLASPPIQSQI